MQCANVCEFMLQMFVLITFYEFFKCILRICIYANKKCILDASRLSVRRSVRAPNLVRH